MFWLCAAVIPVLLDSVEIRFGYLNGLAWDGRYAWAANNEGPPYTRLHRIDPVTMEVKTTYDYRYWKGGFNGLTYGNGRLYAVHFSERTVWEIDTSNGEVVGRYPLETSEYPYGLAFDSSGYWYTDYEAMKVYRLSADSFREFGSWKLSFRPKDAAWWSGLLLITRGVDSLVAIDPARGVKTAEWQLPVRNVAGIAVAHDTLFIGTNSARGMVYRLVFVPEEKEEWTDTPKPRPLWGCLWWPTPPPEPTQKTSPLVGPRP